VSTHTPEAISRLKQILSANPQYPLAHLELARIYQRGNFIDHPAMDAQLNAYFNACPASFNDRATSLLLRSASSEMALKYSVPLRARLERERDPERVALWQSAHTA
jgi:hypothetical protein